MRDLRGKYPEEGVPTVHDAGEADVDAAVGVASDARAHGRKWRTMAHGREWRTMAHGERRATIDAIAGLGPEAGAPIASHHGADHLTVTGSTALGTERQQQAAETFADTRFRIRALYSARAQPSTETLAETSC